MEITQKLLFETADLRLLKKAMVDKLEQLKANVRNDLLLDQLLLGEFIGLSELQKAIVEYRNPVLPVSPE